MVDNLKQWHNTKILTDEEWNKIFEKFYIPNSFEVRNETS